MTPPRVSGASGRIGDRWKLPTTIFGFVVLGLVGAIELGLPSAQRPSDIVIHVMLIVGAGSISPTFILDLIRAWRGNQPPSAP